MDFNTLYETVSPYLGTTGVAGIIVALLYVFIKFNGVIKKANAKVNDFIESLSKSFNETENEALKAFKSALPKDLFINIESIAKTELSAIKDEIWNAVNEKWIGQITKNTALMEAIATALIDNKTIPDSDKKAIAELINKEAQTTAGLKVDLLPVEEEKTTEKVETKILID